MALRELGDPGALERARQRQPRLAKLAVEQLAPELAAARLLLGADRVADLPARLAGHDEVEPVLPRQLARVGQDLDRVAVDELVAQRHELAVDLRARARIADLAVDRVGEVDRRGADRQADHVAARREHEHLVGEQVDLDRLDELVRIGKVAVAFDELAQPGELAVVRVGVEFA